MALSLLQGARRCSSGVLFDEPSLRVTRTVFLKFAARLVRAIARGEEAEAGTVVTAFARFLWTPGRVEA